MPGTQSAHGTGLMPWDSTGGVHLVGVKKVVSFPIWLYCDDTSGNMSKKWNKHNSFLFTAAGLPRQEVHQESNIHFLSTSKVAPPLEMLDAIVEQLELVLFDFIEESN